LLISSISFLTCASLTGLTHEVSPIGDLARHPGQETPLRGGNVVVAGGEM